MRHRHNTHDLAAVIDGHPGRFTNDRTARTFAGKQLSPVLSTVHPDQIPKSMWPGRVAAAAAAEIASESALNASRRIPAASNAARATRRR